MALASSDVNGVIYRFRLFRGANLFKSDAIGLLLCPRWRVFA